MLVPLAVAVLAWIVAYRANSELMQQLLVPILLQLAVLGCRWDGRSRVE